MSPEKAVRRISGLDEAHRVEDGIFQAGVVSVQVSEMKESEASLQEVEVR